MWANWHDPFDQPTTLGKRMLRARFAFAARRGKVCTQGEVGEALGVTEVSVSRWENDKREPTLAHIQQLADFYGVDAAWLAFGTPGESS